MGWLDNVCGKTTAATPIEHIAVALSQIYHSDPRMPRVCIICEPNRRPPYYATICHDHAGVA